MYHLAENAVRGGTNYYTSEKGGPAGMIPAPKTTNPDVDFLNIDGLNLPKWQGTHSIDYIKFSAKTVFNATIAADETVFKTLDTFGALEKVIEENKPALNNQSSPNNNNTIINGELIIEYNSYATWIKKGGWLRGYNDLSPEEQKAYNEGKIKRVRIKD